MSWTSTKDCQLGAAVAGSARRVAAFSARLRRQTARRRAGLTATQQVAIGRKTYPVLLHCDRAGRHTGRQHSHDKRRSERHEKDQRSEREGETSDRSRIRDGGRDIRQNRYQRRRERHQTIKDQRRRDRHQTDQRSETEGGTSDRSKIKDGGRDIRPETNDQRHRSKIGSTVP